MNKEKRIMWMWLIGRQPALDIGKEQPVTMVEFNRAWNWGFENNERAQMFILIVRRRARALKQAVNAAGFGNYSKPGACTMKAAVELWKAATL